MVGVQRTTTTKQKKWEVAETIEPELTFV